MEVHNVLRLFNKIVTSTPNKLKSFIQSPLQPSVLLNIIFLKENLDKVNMVKFANITKFRNVIAHDQNINANIESIHNMIINEFAGYIMHFENVNMRRVKNCEQAKPLHIQAKRVNRLKVDNEKLKQNEKMLQIQVKKLKLELNRTRRW
jgi:hypothetical protein